MKPGWLHDRPGVAVARVKILIGGDVCPVNRYEDLFARGDAGQILGPARTWAQEADLFIANLECPLIEHPDPLEKTGPVLGIPTRCVAGLKGMGLHALGLANNHIMDHGSSGLESTLAACRAQGIAVFGAGATLEEARRVRILAVGGRRIGLCAMAEREWSLATPRKPGANPFELKTFVRMMREAKGAVDYMIVLLHAGAESYGLPSPELMDACRFLVEEGADLVTCQHSHCLGSYEYYQDRLIVYGQGNFIFDYPSHGKLGQVGVLISVELEAGHPPRIEFLPFTQGEEKAGVAALSAGEAADVLGGFSERSGTLADPEALNAAWAEHCEKRKIAILNEVLGYGKVMRRLNDNGLMIKLKGRAYFRDLLSVVQNESGLEALRTILRDIIGPGDRARR